MADRDWEPQLVAFTCQWCTYAGADLAGTSRMEYAPNVRIVKLPCTGRVDPLFLVKAFEQGADGVLVSGCHPGDCHYASGNLLARRRFTVFRELMTFLGLAPERLQFSWVSAAEAVKWTKVVADLTKTVRRLGPQQADRDRAAEQDVTLSSRDLPSGLRAPGSISNQRADAQARIRQLATDLLESGRVQVVVGHGKGSLSGVTRPVFVTDSKRVDELVWNTSCLANLSVYLTRDLVTRLGPVAIVAKGCDAKGLVALLQEHQIAREQVQIIGVQCDGMLEDGQVADKCHACDVRTPPLHDHLVEASDIDDHRVQDPRDAEITALEALSPSERWSYWQAQFARCIRCYACRAVCPLCYCERCIVEETQPQWIPSAWTPAANRSWNIHRAFHLAGRCIGCDECARVCPANIRLDLINRKLAQVISDSYAYRSGYDPSLPPPLTVYQPDDAAEFIR